MTASPGWGVLPLLIACGPQKGTYVPSTETTDTPTGGGTTETTETGTDNDGDGFSVQEGDCDDDEVMVNPAWDEQDGDGLDNDCDGRIDESWGGLVVTEQSRDGRSAVLVFDTVGRVEQEITLEKGMIPYGVAPGLDGGWAVVEYPEFADAYRGHKKYPATLRLVDDSGATTALASFTDESLWTGPPARGLLVHPDGYYLMAGPGALYRIDADGSVTTLETWGWDFTDVKTFELYALELSVDMLTGTVGIFDLLGGFATWSPDGGLSIHKQADLSDHWANWDGLSFASGAWMDGDGWWALGFDYAGTGAYALYRFEGGEWMLEKQWIDDLVPFVLTTDGDHGELYATAKGGDYRTIWKIDLTRDTIDDWYVEVDDGYTVYGIISRY